MRYISSMSLALILLMALACTATPATPAPTSSGAFSCMELADKLATAQTETAAMVLTRSWNESGCAQKVAGVTKVPTARPTARPTLSATAQAWLERELGITPAPTPAPTATPVPTSTPMPTSTPSVIPSPVPTATAIPTPTATPVWRPSYPLKYIDSMNATVDYLRFYEGGLENTKQEYREYNVFFKSDETRYIFWELGLTHFELYKKHSDTKLVVHEQWFRDGKWFKRDDSEHTILSSWVDSWMVSALGSRTPGYWDVGFYEVDLYVEGKFIDRGSFEVYD